MLREMPRENYLRQEDVPHSRRPRLDIGTHQRRSEAIRKASGTGSFCVADIGFAFPAAESAKQNVPVPFSGDAFRIAYHHLDRHWATSRRTIVPVHGNQDLKPGTQRAIMRDAGLTDADL
jgi:hypothetical protein